MSKDFNVGIFVDKSVAAHWGGGYYYQETLLSELAKRNGEAGFVFKVVTNSQSYNHDRLEVVRLPEQDKSNSLFDIISTKLLNKAARRLNINEFLKEKDIHLLYYVQQHLGLTSSFPFVVSNWDMAHVTASGFPDTLKSHGLRQQWVDEYFAKSLAIIADSETGKEEIINYTRVAEDKVFVAPIFPSRLVDLSMSDGTIDQTLSDLNLSGVNYLFYPAQFWALKNHYNLLGGFALAKEKGLNNCKLVVTGSEKGNLKYIQQLVSDLGLEPDVVYTGFISEAQLYGLYRRARALIFPSLLGPTNMPLLEALALSCPVLCSNLKGHREIFGNYGGFFDPLDQDDIAEKIVRINTDQPYRSSLIDELQALKSKSKFNLTNCVDNVFKTMTVVRNKRLCWQ